MITKEIFPEGHRRALHGVPHILLEKEQETFFVGGSHYLQAVKALEVAEKLLEEITTKGHSSETMKAVRGDRPPLVAETV